MQTVNMIEFMTLDLDLGHLAEGVFIRFPFCKVTVPSLTSTLYSLGEKVTAYSYFKIVEFCSLIFMMEYVT